MKRNYESAGTQKAIDFIFKTVEIKKPDLLSLPREMADTVERYVPVFIHTGAFPEELRSPQARKLFVEELCTRYRCEKGVVLKVGKIFGKRIFNLGLNKRSIQAS